MILEWPLKARTALAYLFRPLQDLDIYVEDSGDEVFYSELFGRIAPKGVRVVRVFAVGNRRSVIEQARTHDFAARRALFLIDGDFEWVRGELPPNVPGIHRLEAYCIENLLIHERPVIQVLIEEEAVSEEEARVLFAFGKWLQDVTEPLVNLFISFAILNSVDPDAPTVGLGVGRILSERGKGKGPVLDRQKVDTLRAEVDAKAGASVGSGRFEELLAAMRARVDALSVPVHVVSGKDFLLPLLEFHLVNCSRARVRRKSLRVRLARHCDPARFSPLTAAVESAARL